MGGPCHDHRGPDGNYAPYTGDDVYIPTEWVKQVVGKTYTGTFGRTYECFGYDPREGFWMRTVDEGEVRLTNVSERAIGMTFHEKR